jgi:hypothetical protein
MGCGTEGIGDDMVGEVGEEIDGLIPCMDSGVRPLLGPDIVGDSGLEVVEYSLMERRVEMDEAREPGSSRSMVWVGCERDYECYVGGRPRRRRQDGVGEGDTLGIPSVLRRLGDDCQRDVTMAISHGRFRDVLV